VATERLQAIVVVAEEGNPATSRRDRAAGGAIATLRSITPFCLDWLFQNPGSDWGLPSLRALFSILDMREHLTKARPARDCSASRGR